MWTFVKESYALQVRSLYIEGYIVQLSNKQKKCGVWTADVHVWFHEQYVTDAGAEIVDATITNKRFNSSDSEDMDNFHAILCVSINRIESNITTL